MDLETLSHLGNFFGGIAVAGSLLFLAYELHTSNRLARAQAQRDMRAAWQETLYKMAEYGPEIQEGLVDFNNLNPAKQLICVNIIASMGNQIDTLLKLKAKGLETEDNVRWTMDVFTGIINTPGGIEIWRHLEKSNLFGDDLLTAVRGKLKELGDPSEKIIEMLPWLRFDPKTRR